MSKGLNYTERYEESYISPAQNKLKKKVSVVKADMKKGTSTESLDSNDGAAPVRLATRDDVLQSLGYKPHKVAKPTNTTLPSHNHLCHNCNRRVYPVEKVDVGELYHKGCFKCHTCGLQLTLKTFCKVTQDKNIYCRTHVPKLESSYDKEAVQIKRELEAQKSSTDKLLRKYQPTSNQYDPGALEFEHARKIKKGGKVKRRKSLKTAKDFMRFGVFEAQEKLEQQHREEEDTLYTEFQEERKMQLKRLEKELAAEREKTVKELITWFETQEKSESEKHSGIEKVERYYKEQKETKVKDLLDKLHLEEQEAVARLTHKHAQEMLFMIEQKDHEVGNSLSERQENFKRQTSEKEMEYPNMKKGEEGKDEDEDEDDDDDDDEEEKDGEEDEKEEDEDDEEEEDNEEREDDEKKKINKKINETNDDDEKLYENEGDRNRSITRDDNENIGRIEDSRKKKEIIVGMREQLHRSKETLHLATNKQETDDFESNNKMVGDEIEDVSLKNKKNAEKIKCFPKMQPQQDEDTILENRKKILEGRGGGVGSDEGRSSDGVGVSDGEIESVEDRIKKVLRKEKVGLSGTTLDEEYKLNAQGVAFERASNIWKNANKNEKRKSRRKQEEEEDEDEGFPRMSVAPEAAPPLCRKSKLYRDPSIFEQLDKSAYEESKNDPTSFTDLVRKLTIKCRTDLQKVRAIFRWITAKDLNKLRISENTTTNTPMGLLRGIQTGTESYHNLFKRLCSYVAIHCEIINGFSKGVGYRPGSKFKDGRFRNQWTAVWIKDSWRFVNCNWGARHVKQAEDQKLTYKIDEFYFLTDPEDHIKQHFPDEEKWQLLRHPFTLEDFVRMPVVKSPFFNNQLKFDGVYESIMRASSHGYIEIKIRMPHLMSFASKLESRKVSSHDLSQCCVTRVVSNLVIFSATLPGPGKYFWDIYVDKKCGSKSLDNACCFMIYCSDNSHYTYKKISYPQVPIFGITQEGVKHDLRFEEDHDSFVTAKEELNLRFGIPFLSSTKYYLELLCHNPQLKKKDYSSFAMVRGRTDSMLNCYLRLPFKGYYTFSLSVSDKESLHPEKKQVLYHCLIFCKKPSENQKILPYSTSKWKDCWLVEPMDGELVMNTEVSFTIESKSVEELVIKVNEDWFQMKRSDKSRFHGVVNTGNKAGRIEVFGKSGSKKYTPFLNYNVVQPSLGQQVDTLYKYI